ncbi:Sterile alpha motif [Desmophyllum pertusum]|uniref:Sterile alpha motif n=1 Tax=Desmophyllum pertusum TaxID=174260 RepID=A0A9X0CKU7_9CNID|nr:Sterile alpha motif [Desmophyllum pertusum]
MDSKNVEEWTAEAVSSWLASLGEPYNEYSKAFLDMDIDGDGLLGLVEKGGNALAAEIIPNVAHRLKVIRKINYLARHQGDGNSNSTSQPTTGTTSMKRKMHSTIEEDGDDVDVLPHSVSKKVSKHWEEKKTRTSDMIVAEPAEHAVEAATASNHKASTPQNVVGKTSEMPTFAKRPWPCPFLLPDFPSYVKSELEKKCYASRKIRLQVIRILYDHILQFTEHPSQDQRREVCIALISKYPGQQDATGGYDSWLNFLTNKFKNELYHLTPKEKKTAEAGTQKTKSKVKRELQRGIVHWQPPPRCGENEHSHQINKTWLQKESKRPEKDRNGIKERMELTYAFRRVFLNEEKRPIKNIMREYPCLFDEEEICNEFARLMADDSILGCGINRLLQLTPKILHLARTKTSNSLIQKYLQLLDEHHDDETAALEARDVTDGELFNSHFQ